MWLSVNAPVFVGHGTGVSPLIHKVPIIYIYHLAEAEEKQHISFSEHYCI